MGGRRRPIVNFKTFLAPVFSKLSPACYGAVFDERAFRGFNGGVGNDSSRRIPWRWHLFASAFWFAAGKRPGFLVQAMIISLK
jgi:hypothetical protein